MLLRILDRFEEILIATLMAVATTIIFVAVVHRYSLGTLADLAGWASGQDLDSLVGVFRSLYKTLAGIRMTWAQELCIYLFVWMAKFGAAYGVRTGIHVGVDVIVRRLSPDKQRWVTCFALLAGAFFTATVGTLGARFVLHMAATDQVSTDLEMPMWIVYLCVPFGSYLMSFRFLQVLVNFIRTGEIPHHDHGHVEGVDQLSELQART
ncbi:TRAP transporter small permease [Roseiterribacter gracilis]|uniref:TRAP transporter small permease protein n=1 Tax=Roseiterribacter gracilis TaxID=2812848 RepID=A0A8S8XAZ6_9PROT|nr:C4-dicarboxylate ABC transporter substrate-binding protein [Rhodospirillales bacterium TMPK1]